MDANLVTLAGDLAYQGSLAAFDRARVDASYELAYWETVSRRESEVNVDEAAQQGRARFMASYRALATADHQTLVTFAGDQGRYGQFLPCSVALVTPTPPPWPAPGPEPCGGPNSSAATQTTA